MTIREHSKARPTIEDVAQQAGVSIATVSRVVNQTGPVAEATTQRVLQAIRDLNYTPHSAARVLASNRTQTLGLLLPELSGYFFVPMLNGIESTARALGYNLLIHAAAMANQPQQLPMALGEHNSDGLIVFAHSLPDDELQRLDALGLPLVLLHQSPPPGLEIPNITFENKAGARQLVEHLITAHGCQRIAFLAGPPAHEDSYWREQGYRQALAAHGIPFDPQLVARGDFQPEQARQAVHHLLAADVRMDAIFAADDESASGAMLALREAGVRIPEDIAVAGFDDTQLATHLTPALTTVHAPIVEAGAEAVRILVQRLEGQPVPAEILLATRLVIRGSCGCQPETGASV